MTIAGRREPRFSDITKVRNLGTKFYAMSGKRQTVIIAQNNNGLAEVVSETPNLGAGARDVTYVPATPNTLFILTDDGSQIVDSAPSVPVLGTKSAFDPGDGRWILATSTGSTKYIVTPVDGGVQVLDQAGARTSVSDPVGAGGCRDAVIGSDDVVYGVDEQHAKIHVWRIKLGKALYIDSFRAKNCRDVVKVVLDPVANILFVQCKHRIVGFNVSPAGTTDEAISVTLRQDYGSLKAEYTDFVKVGTDSYWIGVDADSALNPAPEFYGRPYGAWDTPNSLLFTAFPDVSLFAASNVVPYVGEIRIPDVPVIVVPPPIIVIPPPPVVTPAAPVITSSLTASVTEDTVFNYVITATGAGPITYSVVSPPSWLTGINHVTGAISGIPADPGTFNVTIRATNAGGSDTETLVVTVTAAIGNNTAVRTNGEVNGAHVDGTLVYVVGAFTTVTDSSGTVTRNRAACLNVSTGLWTAWNPNLSATGHVVHKNLSHIYIGTRTPAPTLGGTAVSYMGRVDPTTGVVDATWTPTFNGSIYCIRGDADLYVSGAFTSVNGNIRSCLCSFSGGGLTGWDVRTADTPANRLLTNVGGPATSVYMVQPFNGVVGFQDGALRADKNGAGNSDWCGSWGVAGAETGLIAQSFHGFPGAVLSGQTPESLQPTGFTYLYGIDMAGTNPALLPAVPGVPDTSTLIYSVVTMSSAGTLTARARLPFTGGGATGLYDMGGSMLVAGDFSTVTGYPTQKWLVKYDPSSGAVDTGFTYYDRLSLAAQGSANSMRGVRGLPGGACVAYGFIGQNTILDLHGGFRYCGILVLDALTGARL